MLGNEAGIEGAALYLKQVGLWPSSAHLSNLLLAGNRSTSGSPTSPVIQVGNPYAGFDVTLAHLTASDNPAPTFLRAVAPSNSGAQLTVILTNTLIVSATNGFVGNQWVGSGNVLIQHTNTLADKVTTLHHTEAGSPIFQAVNPLSGQASLDNSYHLRSRSDAIDAGVDAGVTVDIDGDVRPIHDGFDIGADEFTAYLVYLPLVQRGQ
jgi:hypothetical protein